MSVAVKTGKGTVRVTREHKFLSGNRVNLCVFDLDDTVRLQFKRREEYTIDRRRETIAEGTSSAPAWPVHQKRRFPGETSVR